MSTHNEEHFEWRKRHEAANRVLQRANADFMNAMGAVQEELRRGQLGQARIHVPELRRKREAQCHAMNAWLAVVEEDAPNLIV